MRRNQSNGQKRLRDRRKQTKKRTNARARGQAARRTEGQPTPRPLGFTLFGGAAVSPSVPPLVRTTGHPRRVPCALCRFLRSGLLRTTPYVRAPITPVGHCAPTSLRAAAQCSARASSIDAPWATSRSSAAGCDAMHRVETCCAMAARATGVGGPKPLNRRA